jgi:Bifunctional DNA primase/polymerase, N-terminal
MSRPSWQLRDAALGYASRGIPVLPLHYPLPDRHDLQPVGGTQPLPDPAAGPGCSCRDPGCGQPAKHPLGALVPHGVNDATTNRARVLAWWTQQPQANIGLACGHTFDVLDIDGPTGAQAMRTFAREHHLESSGPLARTGGGGWHLYLAPTGLGNVHPHGLERVDWRGRGGYVVAPPSRHRSGHPYTWVADRDLDTPVAEVPAPLLERLQHRQADRPTPVVSVPVGDRPGPRYGQAALARELARVAPPTASATSGCGKPPATSTTWSPPAPSTSARSTTSSWPPLSAAACSPMSPARPGALWPPAARSAWPTPARPPTAPAPTPPMLRHPRRPERAANGPWRGGEDDGRRRPPDRLTVSMGWARAAAKQSPHPPRPPRRGGTPVWAAVQP